MGMSPEPGFFSNRTKFIMSLINYIQDVKAELKHINWPNRKQAIISTIAVIVVSAAVAAYLGFFDYLFSQLLTKIIG